jgi:hypothetical protein
MVIAKRSRRHLLRRRPVRPSGADPSRSEHMESRDCWCLPTLEYVSPETGVAVWVHHRPS